MNRLKSAQQGYILAFALLMLSACAGLNPVSKAETSEQRAYALYGTFVVFEEQAVKLVASPEVPESVKRSLREADAVAKPAMDSVLEGVNQIFEIRRQLSIGTSTEEKLTIAVTNLDMWYAGAKPKVEALIRLVKGAQ